MKGRMQLDAVYHEKAFLEIISILGKYKVTDCCMSHQVQPSQLTHNTKKAEE